MQVSKILVANKTNTLLAFSQLVVNGDTLVIEVTDPNSIQVVPANGGIGQFVLDNVANASAESVQVTVESAPESATEQPAS